MSKEFALIVNKLHSASFPLEFRYYKFNNSYGLYVSALSVQEVSDIIVGNALPILNTFEVDHNWSIPNSNMLATLQDVITEQCVPFHAFDSENIAIEKEYLPKLLEGFSHYDFHFYDCPTVLDEIEYIRISDLICESKNRVSILEGIYRSSIWVDSHDDCYPDFPLKRVNYPNIYHI